MLGFRDPIAAAGVEQLPGTACDRKLAYILGKQERALTELLFDHKSRLVCVSVDWVSRSEEIGHHAGDGPAAANVQRPRELHIRLQAGSGNHGGTGGHVLRDIIQLSYRDIARVLGISTDTLLSQLAAARSELRARLRIGEQAAP